MNKFTQTAQDAAKTETVETVATVEILDTFYKRLVDHAYASFQRVDFKELRETLLNQVGYSESMPKLIKVLENFIEDNQFVEAVESERERMKAEAAKIKRTNGTSIEYTID